MSTLKVTNLQNENGIGPAMSINVGGGVTFGSTTPYHIYLNTSLGNVLSVYANQDSDSPGPITTNEWPNVAAIVRGQLFYYVP